MKQRKALAAMITVIVLGAVMVLIGSMMVLTSITEGQATLMERKVKNNQALLDACAEESLLKINSNGTLPSTIVTPLGDCGTTLNSQVGSSWDFDVGANGEMSSRSINVVINRGTTIVVSSWVDQ